MSRRRYHVELAPAICGGHLRVTGMARTVDFLAGLKAAGWSELHILENYPPLGGGDLHAMWAFVQQLIEEEMPLTQPHVA